jgi:paraquat-inducible protein B
VSELPTASVEKTGLAGARARAGRGVSALWFVPVLAVALVGVLFFQAYSQRGLWIEIEFANGEGLRAGDPVSYRGVQVGKVREVVLAPDMTSVTVRVELNKDAAGLAVAGTTFWVVRPELSLTRVSGLETLLGPRYIEASPPTGGAGPVAGGAAVVKKFEGLRSPPRGVSPGSPGTGAGLDLVLSATRLGSITPGSPVVYREVRVGTVVGAILADDAKRVEIAVRIDPPHAHLVRDNSRFWNVSGIGLDLGISGLKLRAGSLESVLAGGIAFATPSRPGVAAEAGARFELADAPEDAWLKWEPELKAEITSPGP